MSSEGSKFSSPKLPPMFVPENHLEELLAEGGKDPDGALAFYKELLSAKVVTLGSFDTEAPVQSGSKFNFRLLAYKNEPVVGVFTSMKRMTDVLPEEYFRKTGFIQVNTRDLLGNVARFDKPTSVVLNPGHTLVMSLSPDRVKALLDGSLFTQIEQAIAQATRPGSVRIPKGTEVFVGKPNVIPTNLMNKMTDYFRRSGTIDRAWIGQILIPSSEQPAHLFVCVKLSPNSQRTLDEVWADLRPTIRQILPEKDLLDVMDAEGEAKAWLERLIPFYP